MENTNKCPLCSNHCDRSNLQCGKGESYFNGEAPREEGRRQGHHKGGHHGHHRPEYPAGSLMDLLARCGHRLFHGGDAAMFDVLTEAEQATLRSLLSKLAADR